MNRRRDGAVECAVQVTPFARRHLRADRQTHRRQQGTDADRIGRKHFADQCHRRHVGHGPRPRDGAGFGFMTGVTKHRAGQDVLRLGVSRHAEAGHIDADDAHPVDGFRQAVQRHPGRRGHTEIDHHDGVIIRRLGDLDTPRCGCPRKAARAPAFRS